MALTQEQRLLFQMKRSLRFISKGERMSEIRSVCFDVICQFRKGKMPQKMAATLNKLFHKHIMDRYADDREANRIGEEKAEKRAEEIKQLICSMCAELAQRKKE